MSAHQQLHAEVETLRQAVRAGERRVQDCANLLTEADAVLRGPLRDAKRLLEAGRKAEAGELLRESHRAAEAGGFSVNEARLLYVVWGRYYDAVGFEHRSSADDLVLSTANCFRCDIRSDVNC